jgi:hypothetical protein
MPNRCAYPFSNPTVTHFFTSTQRSPFSASTSTQPLRAAVPSSHPHSDAGFHLEPESGHDNAHDEDAKDKREAKPEGYEALIFNV